MRDSRNSGRIGSAARDRRYPPIDTNDSNVRTFQRPEALDAESVLRDALSAVARARAEGRRVNAIVILTEAEFFPQLMYSVQPVLQLSAAALRLQLAAQEQFAVALEGEEEAG